MGKKMSDQNKTFKKLSSVVAVLVARETKLSHEMNLVEELLAKSRQDLQDHITAMTSRPKYFLTEDEKGLAKTNKIQAIKAVRERYMKRDENGQAIGIELGLKDAKDLVDDYLASVQ